MTRSDGVRFDLKAGYWPAFFISDSGFAVLERGGKFPSILQGFGIEFYSIFLMFISVLVKYWAF